MFAFSHCVIYFARSVSPKLRRRRGDGIKDRIKIKENAAATVRASGSYDIRKFMELIDARCPSYSVVASKLRGEMRLIILALRDVADQIEDFYIAEENTGLGSVLANKVRACVSIVWIA